jgi:hypothetical protein
VPGVAPLVVLLMGLLPTTVPLHSCPPFLWPLLVWPFLCGGSLLAPSCAFFGYLTCSCHSP